MTRIAALATLLASVWTAGHAQISLTPRSEKAPLDGTFIEEQVMIANGTKVRFSLPDKWVVAAGSETAMTLSSENGSSQIRVEVTNGPTPESFDGLRKMLEARPLPGEAMVDGASDNFQPGPAISGMPTWLHQVNYHFGDRERIRAIWILPMADAQLRFVVDETAPVYSAVSSMMSVVMSSWYWEDRTKVKTLPISGDPIATPEGEVTPASER